MVCIYAMGNVSGAHFNPAVTVCFALTGKLESWLDASKYCLVQMIAGALAGFAYWAVCGSVANLAPAPGYGWVECMVVEILYTCMLCFVVLSVAFAKVTAYNQYYGLAIGFVYIAGGYAAGPISGGAFNPAIAFGVDLSSMGIGFGWCFAYLAYEFAGAAVAALLFRVLYPGEWTGQAAPPLLLRKFLSEFVGTFFLVLTVGLNVLNDSPAAAWSVGCCLVSLIYAFASRSGAHLNPAVTLAVCLSGRANGFTWDVLTKLSETGGKRLITRCPWSEAPIYIAAQLLGGLVGAFSYSAISHKAAVLEPGPGYSWTQVAIAEVFFTFIICSVVLHVATVRDSTKNAASRDMFGLAIGLCVATGGFAIGKISGGSLNPAVSVGIDTTNAVWNGGWSNCLWYSLMEFGGAFLAAGAFYLLRPSEYSKQHQSDPGSSSSRRVAQL